MLNIYFPLIPDAGSGTEIVLTAVVTRYEQSGTYLMRRILHFCIHRETLTTTQVRRFLYVVAGSRSFCFLVAMRSVLCYSKWLWSFVLYLPTLEFRFSAATPTENAKKCPHHPLKAALG